MADYVSPSDQKIASTSGLFTYLDFPICMWKAIRTTNYIESFNADLQRYSNHRILFNSESNEIIVLTACIADYNNTAKKKKGEMHSGANRRGKISIGL